MNEAKGLLAKGVSPAELHRVLNERKVPSEQAKIEEILKSFRSYDTKLPRERAQEAARCFAASLEKHIAFFNEKNDLLAQGVFSFEVHEALTHKYKVRSEEAKSQGSDDNQPSFSAPAPRR